jgi:hypothetical protein
MANGIARSLVAGGSDDPRNILIHHSLSFVCEHLMQKSVLRKFVHFGGNCITVACDIAHENVRHLHKKPRLNLLNIKKVCSSTDCFSTLYAYLNFKIHSGRKCNLQL